MTTTRTFGKIGITTLTDVQKEKETRDVTGTMMSLLIIETHEIVIIEITELSGIKMTDAEKRDIIRTREGIMNLTEMNVEEVDANLLTTTGTTIIRVRSGTLTRCVSRC